MGRSPSPIETEVETTPRGMIVFALSLALLGVGAIALSAPVVVAGLLLSLICVGIRLLAVRRVEAVSFHRALPQRAWAGRPFRIDARLTNPDSIPALDLFLHDPLSRPRRIDSVVSRGSHSLAYTGTSPARGIWRFDSATLVASWPFGAFAVRRKLTVGRLRGGDGQILVRPDPYLPPLLRHHLDRQLAATPRNSGFADPAAEFRFLREFRNGDPVRRIHWPASLKGGEILVRETDPPAPDPLCFGVLLHGFSPVGELVVPEQFESLLRILAGMLCRFRSAEAQVVLAILPDEPRRLAEPATFDRALDRLATLRRAPFSDTTRFADAALAFEECDELFVLGDTPQARWGDAALEHLGPCHLVDPGSLALSRRPSLRRRALPHAPSPSHA